MRVPSTKPPAGFRMWWNPYGTSRDEPMPHHFELVEVWDAVSFGQYVVAPARLHPAQNVANWYWRPVREYGEILQ